MVFKIVLIFFSAALALGVMRPLQINLLRTRYCKYVTVICG